MQDWLALWRNSVSHAGHPFHDKGLSLNEASPAALPASEEVIM